MKDKYQYLEELSEANMAQPKKFLLKLLPISAVEFTKRQEQLDTLLSSKDQLILANKRGEYAYNFYTDGDHPRGLWRRTSFDSYLAYVSPETEPEWEVLLDIDELGKMRISHGYLVALNFFSLPMTEH